MAFDLINMGLCLRNYPVSLPKSVSQHANIYIKCLVFVTSVLPTMLLFKNLLIGLRKFLFHTPDDNFSVFEKHSVESKKIRSENSDLSYKQKKL